MIQKRLYIVMLEVSKKLLPESGSKKMWFQGSGGGIGKTRATWVAGGGTKEQDMPFVKGLIKTGEARQDSLILGWRQGIRRILDVFGFL